MLNIVLIALGTLILCASGLICQKLNFKEELGKIKSFFSLLFYLIIFFICGYIFFIIKLFKQTAVGQVHLSTVSLIFFFGALFVYVSMKISEKLIKTIEEKSKNLDKVNRELMESNNKLTEYAQKMKLSENKYKDKSQDLEKTLDDYYCMTTVLKKQSQQ